VRCSLLSGLGAELGPDAGFNVRRCSGRCGVLGQVRSSGVQLGARVVVTAPRYLLGVTRARVVFRCLSCGAGAAKWSGRCQSCGDWNTLSEELETPPATAQPEAPTSPLVPVTDVPLLDGGPVASGIDEFDRVLGGGLVPGSVTLLSGEPGVGKSTLVLQLLAASARAGRTSLYVTGEESAGQVRLRAERIGALHPQVLLTASNSLADVLVHLDAVRPSLCVVDSIQTLSDATVGSAPGSVVQVRECAQRLVAAAKRFGVPVVLVGHVTKEGHVAGPQTLTHVVDTVLTLEGDRHHDLRLLRTTKHRFGSTDEVGVFRSLDGGLVAVPDPSELFLADRHPDRSGSAVCAACDGSRSLLVEVQGLVVPTAHPQPRRSGQGIEVGRLALLLAVLHQRAAVDLSRHDVYTATVGGARIAESAADLAVCAALASAAFDVPLPEGVVLCGEVGLGGELRAVGRVEHRVAEAIRIGALTVVVPRSTPPIEAESTVGSSLRVQRIGSLPEALNELLAA